MPQGWTPVADSSGWTPVDPAKEATKKAARLTGPRTWGESIRENLPSIGGLAGSLLGEGWASIPAAAILGAGGEAARQHIRRIQGLSTANTPLDAAARIATEGGIQGALETGGMGVAKGLELTGRGLYRMGAMPQKHIFNKYGDVIKTGLEDAVPVTRSGLTKASRLKDVAMGAKREALTEAGSRAAIRPQTIADEVMTELQPGAAVLQRTGDVNPSGKYAQRAAAFVRENHPPFFTSPLAMDEVKSSLDDQLGGAYQKIRQREPLTPDERFELELSHGIGRAQQAVVPQYHDLNARIMETSGLEKVIKNRLLPANQGLENALTAAVGPTAIPGRLLMLPGVASRLGIAAYHTGKMARPLVSNASRALLAALAQQSE